MWHYCLFFWNVLIAVAAARQCSMKEGGSMYYPMDALIYLLILVLNLGEGQEGIVVFHLCISIYSVG